MLLAVDTSTPQIGLALYDGAQVWAESIWTSKARHTEELAPAVAEILKRTGIKIEQIKALGVAIGPGSFTALRVGLSFVKGLSLACGLPVIGINTLDVVAASQAFHTLPHLVCTLPAGRGRLAAGWYEWNQKPHVGWQARGNPSIVTAGSLAETIDEDCSVCGDLNIAERSALKKNLHIRLVSPALSTRRPAVLAELAFLRWQANKLDDVASLTPIYLHLAEPIPSPNISIERKAV